MLGPFAVNLTTNEALLAPLIFLPDSNPQLHASPANAVPYLVSKSTANASHYWIVGISRSALLKKLISTRVLLSRFGP